MRARGRCTHDNGATCVSAHAPHSAAQRCAARAAPRAKHAQVALACARAHSASERRAETRSACNRRTSGRARTDPAPRAHGVTDDVDVHLANGSRSRHHDSAEQRPGRAAHLGAQSLLTCDAPGVLTYTRHAHGVGRICCVGAEWMPTAHRCGGPGPADAAAQRPPCAGGSSYSTESAQQAALRHQEGISVSGSPQDYVPRILQASAVGSGFQD
jgi:hypothetical protein